MTDDQRQRLYDRLMQCEPMEDPSVLTLVADLVTKDIDAIEPLIDDMLREAREEIMLVMNGPRCPKCGKRFVNRALRDEHYGHCKSEKYMLVICGQHGSDPRTDDTVPGYIVCKHVMDEGAPVASSCLAKDELLGSIVCEIAAAAHASEDLRLVCSVCARQRGWVAAA